MNLWYILLVVSQSRKKQTPKSQVDYFQILLALKHHLKLLKLAQPLVSKPIQFFPYDFRNLLPFSYFESKMKVQPGKPRRYFPPARFTAVAARHPHLYLQICHFKKIASEQYCKLVRNCHGNSPGLFGVWAWPVSNARVTLKCLTDRQYCKTLYL